MLTAVGITCGVGSMLIGAKRQGYDVLGNIEWRPYYHAKDSQGRNTFLENYPGSFMVKNASELGDLSAIKGATLAMSHPECGAYSNMRMVKTVSTHASDIPIAIDLINQIKPRFFAMDELPKAMIALPSTEWAARLPDYDIFFEWVSNFHYGNIQRGRKRLFILGAHKDEKFVFVPGEEPNEDSLKDVIGDLHNNFGSVPNHEPIYAGDDYCSFAKHMRFRGDRPTWAETIEFMAKWPARRNFEYEKEYGTRVDRFGFLRASWGHTSPLLTGTNPTLHPTGRPMSVRERARIQGAPDDFVFYGSKLEPDGSWHHQRNHHMVRQSGKFMPVQFCSYFSKQVKAHVIGKKFTASRKRYLVPNPFVDVAKQDYCARVGYGESQKAVCRECWLTDRCDMRKAVNPNWQGIDPGKTPSRRKTASL